MLIILIELKRTRAQGHRTTEQSRLELVELMSPTLLLEEGHLAQVQPLRAVSSWVLNICEDGGSTTSLGDLFQCLPALTRSGEEFLTFKFPIFKFVSIAFHPITGREQPWPQRPWWRSSGPRGSSRLLRTAFASFLLYFLHSTYLIHCFL